MGQVSARKKQGEETARLWLSQWGVVGAIQLGVHGLFGDEISFPMIFIEVIHNIST
jgi:hypothetical protein